MAFTARMLVTDLDGLGSGTGAASGLAEAFCGALRSLRPAGDNLWVVFGRRSKRQALQRLFTFQAIGCMPDFLILRHWRIYRRTRVGYAPCILWNIRILKHMIQYPIMARRILDAWYEEAVRRFEKMRTLIRTEHHLRMRFDSMEDADLALAPLEQVLSPFRHVRIFRKDVEVEIRPVPFIKGLALSELCHRLDVDPQEVLTIVQTRSDLSLVDGHVAAHCGCPANADPRILQAVHHAGGHVARSKELNGALEVILAHQAEQVLSDLPVAWKVPKKEMSLPERPWSNPRRRRILQRTIALVICVYVILAVFASFDLVPMSDLILGPCKSFASGIGRLFQLW